MFYWFRYMCLLMLRTRTGNDYASDLATARPETPMTIPHCLVHGPKETPFNGKGLSPDFGHLAPERLSLITRKAGHHGNERG